MIDYRDKTNQALQVVVDIQLDDSGVGKHLQFYTNYWCINLTEFPLVFRQENRRFKIAGSEASRKKKIQHCQDLLAKHLLQQLSPETLSNVSAESPPDHEVGDSSHFCQCAQPECEVKRLAEYATMFSFSTTLVEEVPIFSDNLCIKVATVTNLWVYQILALISFITLPLIDGGIKMVKATISRYYWY